MKIFGYRIKRELFWTIVGVIVGTIALIIALYPLICPPRVKLDRPTEKKIDKIDTIEKKLEILEKRLGKPIYVDGLPSADSSVFDPFAKGLKLMTEYKWDEAIAEFKQSMKEAKASQLVALYSLIGLCYYTPGKLDLALENWNKSLSLSREFNDREGESAVLGNLGIVYRIRGELDKAIKYHEDALKIDREMRNKYGEASDLDNLGSVYEEKGEKEKSFKYYEDALRLFTQIGAKKEIEMVKENIERLRRE
ncbi:MAG: tetratricopeptide repeat protein [Candidatus Zixiibacteriota bacterium]